MADITLRAQVRTLKGKKVGALRRQGIIPANIYGRGIESLPIQVDVRAFRDALAQAGSSTVVDVHISDDGHADGKSHPVLIENVSTHPATGKVLHIDLRQVDLNRPVRAHVPLVLIGESPAVKNEGAVLMHPMDTIEVEALPRALPHEIQVDVSTLAEVDQQITLGDLRLPEGVTVEGDPTSVVAQVIASKMEQEVAAEEAEAAAEAAETAEAAEEGEAPEGGEAAEGDSEKEGE
ncbi:MAG TPA: 50S ribosomal protein L25 [Chloroflexota bacterium]|nr:50S ribosomal protein L25 [Chloroflexota bacterium]